MFVCVVFFLSPTLLGVLVPVSASSDVFLNRILGPLKSAYLYEESKQCFRYKSAVLIKNPALEEKVSEIIRTCILYIIPFYIWKKEKKSWAKDKVNA